MSFLFPSFLWGLLALAVPIAIHLFNFRRTRRVYFTNVALLQTVQTTTRSFRRLRDWLILLARCLFLAALVAAFAQPFIPSKSSLGLSRQGATSLYIDNSFSMQNEEANNAPHRRYIDIAVSKLDQLLTLFRNATSLQLLTNDFSADEQQTATAEAIRDRLASVKLAHTPRTLEAVYRRQRNLLASTGRGGTHQLFWFSDFQKSTAGDLRRLKIDTADRLFVVPVTAQAERNVAVDSVWLTTPFVREMQNNSLNVRLHNSGKEAVQNLPIRLYLDDVQASTASVNLPANGTSDVTLTVNVTKKGFHRGRVFFDDQPITFDNDYYFVIEASPAIRVLHLFGQKTTPDYIQAVFENDSLFAFRQFSAQNFDVGQLKGTDLVVLEGVSQVSGTLRTELDQFVKQGGSMVVIPPARPDGASYGPFLSSLNVPGVQVSPADAAPIPVAEPDRRNPFFADVFQQGFRQEVLNMPQAAPVWQWNGGDRLLTLRSGQSFLTQSRVGGGTAGQQGQLYILASPLSADYGNLAQHALFVPVMYKMAALSVRPQRTAYSFDDNVLTFPAVANAGNAADRAVYKLKNKSLEIIPVQRVVGNQLILELPKANQLTAGQSVDAGYYELQRTGENGAPQTERIIALNHGRAESQMAFYSPAELRQAFANQPNIEVFDSIQDSDFGQALERENLGTNLWPYCIMAALAFLLLEILLVRLLKA
ncbi:BatA domain-containing protein [Fibrella forsythiae]|uniref:BatA domain-containing protein n=1 Tax=Fibrella forsythiae TaxID=2817061 RepID=A0ABS3JQ37_9BACT|nr:BatA domain-containing protein [Fibrella forsythiae]MBO0952102.1 BatA domain-containing protein [Fibrella forsythiae]